MRELWRTAALALLLLSSVPTSSLGAPEESGPGSVVHIAEVQSVAEDDEAFRQQMITFVQEMDVVLTRLAEHPTLTERVEAAAAIHTFQVPLSPATYEVIENASSTELAAMRQAINRVPNVLQLPATLDVATRDLPVLADPGRARAVCADNETENTRIISLQGQLRTLTRTVDSLNIVYSVIKTVEGIVYAATQDIPYVGGIPAIPLLVVSGVLDVVIRSVSFAVDDFAYQEELAQLCIASCLKDVDDFHQQPSERWRRRGCDNRDNNCIGGIDEPGEDLYPPVASIDASVIGQCFPDTNSARQAVEMAIKAQDDCTSVTKSVSVAPPSPVTCQSSFAASVRDVAGNVAPVGSPVARLTVDGTPPMLVPATLGACYPTLAAARDAFAGPAGVSITDCTEVETRVDVVEKECEVDLALTAVDACQNQNSVRDTVRVDGSPPVVNIERLTIPAIDGLSCFDSEAEAVAAVDEATRLSDECTAVEDLVSSTTTSGTQCDLLVQAAAMDQCGNASSDSLLVRVDSAPPVVSCSLATTILFPSTDALVDVGFTYSATDECDPAGPQVEITVTSDEPTALAYSAIERKDPRPDAIIEYARDGSVARVLVRAQASKSEGADGRIYRLRVTATDSCGLQSKADCFVSVPRTPPGPGSAVNSGQLFDATVEN